MSDAGAGVDGESAGRPQFSSIVGLENREVVLRCSRAEVTTSNLLVPSCLF